MDRTQFDLLKTKRFLPLFVTQALGALNDNVFKNAMAILMVYKLAEAGGYDKAVLATAAGGVFILPFFLFSATRLCPVRRTWHYRVRGRLCLDRQPDDPPAAGC
jgi:hypothetical protein